jgi:hypothetical protein
MSAQEAAGPYDEIIVIGDGPLSHQVTFGGPLPVIISALPARVGDYGCSALDYGMQLATGDYVFFIGDDDLVAPNAFNIIREAVKLDPGVPHLFAMEHTGRILQGSLECGQVSGQQIVVPRDMAKMPKMADFPPHQVAISDYYFIKEVEKAWGRIVMRPETIAVLPVMNQGRML